MALYNIPEDYLYQKLPEGLILPEFRGLVQALLGGFQDLVSELRGSTSTFLDFYDPRKAPEIFLPEFVVVFYTEEGGQTNARIVQNESYDSGAPEAWAAAQLGLDVDRVISVTSSPRLIDAKVLQKLAETIGGIIYLDTENPNYTAVQRSLLETHFPLLKIKGTARSFDVLSRTLNGASTTVTPLWGRVSPRNPLDVGDSVNDDDFSGVPEIAPSSQLPDPTGVYDPLNTKDGPVYEWVSEFLSISPTADNYILRGVNGANPFIRLVATGALFLPSPGEYRIEGGGSLLRASVALEGAGLSVESLTEGELTYPVYVTITRSEDDTTVQFRVKSRLSRIKYRTSYYDQTVSYETARYKAAYPPIPVLDSDSGSVARKPLGGFPIGVVPPTTLQLDPFAISERAIEVARELESMRVATRLPRKTKFGWEFDDRGARFAPYINQTQIISSGSIGGLLPFPEPKVRNSDDFAARFYVAVDGTERRGEIDGMGGVVFQNGSISSDLVYNFSESGTYTIRWIAQDSEAIRPEPTLKSNGTISYQTRPEDGLTSKREYLDEYTFRRDLTGGGEDVDRDYFEGNQDLLKLREDLHVIDIHGVPRTLKVFSPDSGSIARYEVGDPAPLGHNIVAHNASEQPFHVMAHDGELLALGSYSKFNENLRVWVPFSDHPESATTVRTVGPTPVSFTTNIEESQRVWDAARGWVLRVPTKNGEGTLEGKVVLPEYYALTFWIKPDPNASPKSGSIMQIGAINIDLRPGTVRATYPTATGITGAEVHYTDDGSWRFVSVKPRTPGLTGSVQVYGVGQANFSQNIVRPRNETKTFVNTGTADFVVDLGSNVRFSAIDVAVGTNASYTSWSRVPSLASKNPVIPATADVFEVVKSHKVAGTTQVRFGDNIAGRAVPQGYTVEVAYEKDFEVLDLRSDDISYNISDLRITGLSSLNQLATLDDSGSTLAVVQNPTTTPTIIPYPQTLMPSVDRSELFAFKVIGRKVFPVAGFDVGNPIRNRSHEAAVFRYMDGTYLDTDSTNLRVGLGGSGTHPGNLAYEGQVRPTFVFSGTEATSGSNARWFDTGFGFNPAAMAATNPAQQRIFLRGITNREVYEVKARSNDDGEYLAATSVRHLRGPLDRGTNTSDLSDKASNAAWAKDATRVIIGGRELFVRNSLNEVPPAATESTTSSVMYSRLSRTNQIYYNADYLPDHDLEIHGLETRLHALDPIPGERWPQTPDHYTAYDVWVGYASPAVEAAGVIDLSTPFEDNVVEQQLVRSGPLTVPAWSFDRPGSLIKSPYGFPLRFDRPFKYEAGRDLVITIRHSGHGGVLSSIAIALTSSAVGVASSTRGASYGAATPDLAFDPAILNLLTNETTQEVFTGVATDAPTRPTYLYLREKSEINLTGQDLRDAWVPVNTDEIPGRATAGDIEFVVPDTLTAGTYKLRLDVGNKGTPDFNFKGFRVEVSVGGLVSIGTGRPIVLSPDGSRQVTEMEFDLPVSITDPDWTLKIRWLNDVRTNDPSRVRFIQVYGVEFVRQLTDLYRINVSGEDVVLDAVDVTTADNVGGYVDQINSHGTVARRTHESRWFNESLRPVSNLLTGSSLRRTEDMISPLMVTPQPVRTPMAINSSVLSVASYSGSNGTHSQGELGTFLSVVQGYVPPNSSHSWRFWDDEVITVGFTGSNAVASTGTSTVSKYLNRSGSHAYEYKATSPFGESYTAIGSLVVLGAPVIDSLAITYNQSEASLQATAHSPQGGTVSYLWGTLVQTGTGPDFTFDTFGVDTDVSLMVRDSGTRTTSLSIPVPGRKAQGVSLSSVTFTDGLPTRSINLNRVVQALAADTFVGVPLPESLVDFSFNVTDANGTQHALATHKIQMEDKVYGSANLNLANYPSGLTAVSARVHVPVDGRSGTSTTYFTVSPKPAPVISPVIPLTGGSIPEGDSARFRATAVDPDGMSLRYRWSFVSLPPEIPAKVFYGREVAYATGTRTRGRTINGLLTVSDYFGNSGTTVIPPVRII